MKSINELQLSNPGTDTINLDQMQISDMKLIIPQLQKFENLNSLSLHSNKIKMIPKEISRISLNSLDISENPLIDLQDVCSTLKNIRNLRHLIIDLTDEKEVDVVLTQLPDLMTLNEKEVNDADMKEDTVLASNQADLEEIAEIYDSLRETLKQHGIGDDDQYSHIFDNQSKQVIQDIRTAASAGNKMINQVVIENKLKLYVMCLERLSDQIEFKDKAIAGIANTIFSAINRENGRIGSQIKSDLSKKDIDQNKNSTLDINNLMIDIEEFKTENDYLKKENESLKKKLNSAGNVKKNNFMNDVENSNQKSIQENNGSSFIQSNMKMNASEIKLSKEEVQKNGAGQINLQTQRTELGIDNIKPRNLSIKAVKDVINEIYTSKEKQDRKCLDNMLPRETMEQHMQNFFNQKQGLKKLTLEWSSSILHGIKKQANLDNDVAFFGKVLQNEVDEEYRQILADIKKAIQTALKRQVQEKNALKPQRQINDIQTSKIKGKLTEGDYTDLIHTIQHSGPEHSDVDIILSKINQIVDSEFMQSTEVHFTTKMTRQEIEQAKRNQRKVQSIRAIPFDRFLNLLLDFSLLQHEKFLSKFVELFNSIDSDRDGIIDEEQMITVIERLNIVESEEHINTILQRVDPHNNKLITFSDCVKVFTETEVIIEGQEDGVDRIITVNVIEKLNNLE